MSMVVARSFADMKAVRREDEGVVRASASVDCRVRVLRARASWRRDLGATRRARKVAVAVGDLKMLFLNSLARPGGEAIEDVRE
jgi:hypothetical protein